MVSSTIPGIVPSQRFYLSAAVPLMKGSFSTFFCLRANLSSYLLGFARQIGFRMLMPGGDVGYDEDPEGLALASAINMHLPSTVRVGAGQGG